MARSRILLDSNACFRLVAQFVSYWKHENDLPGNFHQEYRRLFGSTPPQEEL